MARTLTPDTLATLLTDLARRIETLERTRRSGIAVVPADPPNARPGDVWLRTSDGAYRVRLPGGAIGTVTVS